MSGFSASPPVVSVLASVVFNGVGVVNILESFNVSSITDNGVGDYTVNFATPMKNANYAVFCNVQKSRSDRPSWVYHLQPNQVGDFSTNSVRVVGGYVSGTNDGNYNAAVDIPRVSLVVIGRS